MSWGKTHNCEVCEHHEWCIGYITLGSDPCPQFKGKPLEDDPLGFVLHHIERALRMQKPGFYK